MFRNLKLKFSANSEGDRTPQPDVAGHVPPSDLEAAAARQDEHAQNSVAFDLFEQDITRIAKSLSREILTARDKSTEARDNLGKVQSSMRTLVSSSEQIDEEIAGIAQSTEELSAAASEIFSTVATVQDRAASTLHSADASSREMESLGAAVSEIGGLLNSISEIATRTNLLALNATIEAARAGEAGRGFAVVAGEVKALSVAAAQSVSAIRARMEALQRASLISIDNMHRIREEIGGLTPICETIAGAAQEQRTTIGDLAARMQVAQNAVSRVSEAVRTVDRMTEDVARISLEAGEQSAEAANEAGDLERRVVTILRTMPAADRRKHERFPIDLAMRVKSGGEFLACRSFDISEGGVLIKPQDGLRLAIGTTYDVEIARVGNLRMRVVNLSPLGTHCCFDTLPQDARQALMHVLEAFGNENRVLIERAQNFAGEIVKAVEAEMKAGRLGLSAVFDTNYTPIPDTDPVQFRTLYLERFETLLPPIIERTLLTDQTMAFCVAIDRNGYIPVHIKKVSQPQRKGDRAWNHANARHRRIFDDRAGLLAGRVMRPYLVQNYHRDMGNGLKIPMKEIDAPLVIAGRHWGGVRMAYTI